MRHEGVGEAMKMSVGTSYHEDVDSTDLLHDEEMRQVGEFCEQASRSRGFHLDLSSNTVSESKVKSHSESNERETTSEVEDMSLHCSVEDDRNVQNSEDTDLNISLVTEENTPTRVFPLETAYGREYLQLLPNLNIPLVSDENSPARAFPRETGYGRVYLPLLPNDVARNILSRICLTNMLSASFVSKMWNAFILRPPHLYQFRRSMRIREDWIFILGNNMENTWKVYRPLSDDWLVLPPCPNDYMFNSCDKESIVAGFNLLVFGQSLGGYKIWMFDIIRNRWVEAPRMHHPRCLFGSANAGLYAYFGGGTYNGLALKCAERFNSETGRWEILPDLNIERKSCSGFIMDGKFFVIGGHNNVDMLDTGEYYDPNVRSWSVVEGMWPRAFVPTLSGAPPLVAVLDNQLYAINILQNKLLTYVKELNQWTDLGEVPQRGLNFSGWGLGFKTVGDELFIIGGSRDFSDWLPYIHAYKPTSRRSGTWRFVVDIQAPTSGFIFNCAVMSA